MLQIEAGPEFPIRRLHVFDPSGFTSSMVSWPRDRPELWDRNLEVPWSLPLWRGDDGPNELALEQRHETGPVTGILPAASLVHPGKYQVILLGYCC